MTRIIPRKYQKNSGHPLLGRQSSPRLSRRAFTSCCSLLCREILLGCVIPDSCFVHGQELTQWLADCDDTSPEPCAEMILKCVRFWSTVEQIPLHRARSFSVHAIFRTVYFLRDSLRSTQCQLYHTFRSTIFNYSTVVFFCFSTTFLAVTSIQTLLQLYPTDLRSTGPPASSNKRVFSRHRPRPFQVSCDIRKWSID